MRRADGNIEGCVLWFTKSCGQHARPAEIPWPDEGACKSLQRIIEIGTHICIENLKNMFQEPVLCS